MCECSFRTEYEAILPFTVRDRLEMRHWQVHPYNSRIAGSCDSSMWQVTAVYMRSHYTVWGNVTDIKRKHAYQSVYVYSTACSLAIWDFQTVCSRTHWEFVCLFLHVCVLLSGFSMSVSVLGFSRASCRPPAMLLFKALGSYCTWEPNCACSYWPGQTQ